MAPLRRLLVLAALALGASAASADDANATNAAVKPACAVTSLKAADAPVRAPLAAVVGAKLVDTVFNFLTDTPFGKLLAGEEAQTCMANLNGTVLGQTLLERLKTPTCAPLYNLTDVPFVKYTLEALVPNASAPSSTPTLNDQLKYLKAVPNAQVEQFCGLYVSGVVPCLATELLPALAALRSKFAGGCCDAWTDRVLADFGYSVSGQVTKFAQLFGDVMCAQQTPGWGDAASQRCGYTAMQTLLAKPDEASLAAAVLRNLQVPTDQMCLRAEGKPYVDTNNNSVTAAAASEPVPSGCAVTLDRITSWMYTLPSTQKSTDFDVRLLLEDGKCLRGSELFPTFKRLLPPLASGEIEVFFDKSCVHLPMQFGGKCAFARQALLVEWRNEPQPVAAGGDADAGEATATAATTTTVPAAPAATPLASSKSSASALARSGGALLLVLVALLSVSL